MPKEFAKRFPTDTAMEVYSPSNPPPGGSETDLQAVVMAMAIALG